MEDTLALIVASSRALLGASPPAALAAGSRWGEGNGRMAAADGIYRWGGMLNPSRSDQVASRTWWAWALCPYVGHWSWRPPENHYIVFL